MSARKSILGISNWKRIGSNVRMGRLYVLRNTLNGKCYVGQTIVPLKRRLKNHKISSSAIGNAIRKYGVDSFKIIEFAGIPEHLLDGLETDMILKVNSVAPFGYNIMLGGQKTRRAPPISDETRRKMSKAQKGRKHTTEAIENIRKGKMGHAVSDEQRKKLSEIGKKRWAQYTDEERTEKGVKARLEELRQTEAGRQKLRKAYENRPAWNKEKKLSDEHRKKLSLAHIGNESGHKGHKHSAESKKKMSESRQKYLERKAEEDR